MTHVTRRRRLLTIAHSYAVGVNRRLAEAFAQQNWDVTAIAPDRFRGDFGWHTVESRRERGYVLEAVPAHFARSPHMMLYGRGLHDLLQQPWDLVHCWEEPYVASAAQVAAYCAPRVPLVFATFQNISKRYPPPFNWFERYSLARADAIVAFGHTALSVLEERGFASRRTRVIPPGVDTSHFKPDATARVRVRRTLGWDDDVPVVGFLGRLIPAKGLPLLTDVLDGLSTPWRALIVGSGPLESRLRTWAARHGTRVSIQTGVAHDDVPAWLNAMDVLCAPSQTTARWREQFGRMLIEAAACGVPVIASDSGEISHVVGDAGVIVSERDLDAWVGAVERVLGDPVLRSDLSCRGRTRAESLYDWRVVGRQHLSLFEELLEGGVPAPHRAA